MTFTSPVVALAYQDARLALESGEPRFFLTVNWRRGGLLGGGSDKLSGGSVPLVGACIAAVESLGWELEHLDSLLDTQSTGNVITCALFHRDLR